MNVMADSPKSPQTPAIAPLPVLDESTAPNRWIDERFSLPPAIRIPLTTSLGLMAGSILGMSHGGHMAALRFRAENAHRVPTSQKGWYFYHKSKNAYTMLGGLKEGAKMAPKVAFWVCAFVTLEDAVDTSRGGDRHKDFLSTVLAALTTSGAFSLWNRFPLRTAARTARLALKIGLVYGLGQDALSLLRGRRLAYVDILRGNA